MSVQLNLASLYSYTVYMSSVYFRFASNSFEFLRISSILMVADFSEQDIGGTTARNTAFDRKECQRMG